MFFLLVAFGCYSIVMWQLLEHSSFNCTRGCVSSVLWTLFKFSVPTSLIQCGFYLIWKWKPCKNLFSDYYSVKAYTAVSFTLAFSGAV